MSNSFLAYAIKGEAPSPNAGYVFDSFKKTKNVAILSVTPVVTEKNKKHLCELRLDGISLRRMVSWVFFIPSET